MVNTAAIFLSTFSGLKEQGKFTFLWYNHRAGRRGKKFISSKEKRAPINSLQRSGVGKIAYSIPFNYQKLSKEVTSRQAQASHLSKFLTCSITNVSSSCEIASRLLSLLNTRDLPAGVALVITFFTTLFLVHRKI